jgi:hypothetical protein
MSETPRKKVAGGAPRRERERPSALWDASALRWLTAVADHLAAVPPPPWRPDETGPGAAVLMRLEMVDDSPGPRSAAFEVTTRSTPDAPGWSEPEEG